MIVILVNIVLVLANQTPTNMELNIKMHGNTFPPIICDYHNQHGASNLLMVMMIAIISSFLLQSLGQSLLTWQKSALLQIKYYQQFNRAYSAIHWATTQLWTEISDKWHCQSQQQEQLYACVKYAQLEGQNFIIIKGEAEKLTLYHLAYHFEHHLKIDEEMFTPATGNFVKQELGKPDIGKQSTDMWRHSGQIQLALAGWLDYCPENNPQYCQ